MSDERSRRFQRVAKESETIALTLGGIALVLVLAAVLGYAGKDPDASVPAWAVLIGLLGLLVAPFSAASAGVSYVAGVLAETERMS